MSNLRGEALYRAAFERLKEGKGEIDIVRGSSLLDILFQLTLDR